MEGFIFVILISAYSVTSVYLRDKSAQVPECNDSLKSVHEGFRCPSNKTEWEERAREMKCETLSQNCTDTNNFVYHCLLNAWVNGTIEVCAPEVQIAGGFCAEFSKGGARIHAQYQSKCNSCPFMYNSSKSYKYEECYELVKIPEMSTKPDVSYKRINDTDTNTTSEIPIKRNNHGGAFSIRYIIILCGICILLLVFVVLVLGRCYLQYGANNLKPDANKLELNEKLVNFLCKFENKEPESLKKDIHKCASNRLKPNHYQVNVNGNFQEVIDIQAAADALDMKIFIVTQTKDDKETAMCFMPKYHDTEKWIKFSVDQENEYRLLSSWVNCDEETACLTTDHVHGKRKKKKRECLPWETLQRCITLI